MVDDLKLPFDDTLNNTTRGRTADKCLGFLAAGSESNIFPCGKRQGIP